MRNLLDIKESDLLNNQKVKTGIAQHVPAIDLSEKGPALELLTTEDGKSFYNYIDWLGLAKDPGLIVLSSMHHYYYDTDDLKDIRTVVNLMPLNQIKNNNGLFHTIYHLIPHKCYFIGCFADHKKHFGFIFKNNPLDKHTDDAEHAIKSRIPLLNILYRIIDSRTDKFLTAKNVTLSLENLGFKVLDMTEFNGITYFCAQKVLSAAKNS
jgi:hypothetical protein